jgi:putative Mn2+ efflux pump MntP
MVFFEILLIAIGLSMDCFAVSLGFGACRKFSLKDILLLSFLFGFFQGFMTLIGWFAGNSIQSLIQAMDHWIAFGLLAFIGIKMIWQSFHEEEENKPESDIRKISVMLTASVATSIDALITGVGFGFIRVNILTTSLVIGLTTFLFSVAGAKLGEKTTFIPVRWAEITGGVVLIAIGVKIVLEHLAVI